MSAGREFQVDGAATEKRDEPVRCVCEEWPAAEQWKSAEPEVVHGSVRARWDMMEWLWSTPCESEEPLCSCVANSATALVMHHRLGDIPTYNLTGNEQLPRLHSITSPLIKEHSESANLSQGQNINQKWSRILHVILISGLILIWMSMGLLPKCCGLIALLASVILLIFIKISQWPLEKL